MFISNLTERGATPALQATVQFHQARLTTLAENVANHGVPFYRAKHLDVAGFQHALKQALKERGGDPNRPFSLRGAEARSRSDGTLAITPSERPVESLLFHDDTNVFLEKQMTDLVETSVTHRFAAYLLRSRFDGLQKAIRGNL